VTVAGNARLRLKLLNDGEQVADRAGAPVQPDYDQRLVGGDVAQQAGCAIDTGGMLLKHRRTAGRAQLIALRIGAMVLGGDPGIADEAAGGGFA
jgi:hypothetical protein